MKQHFVVNAKEIEYIQLYFPLSLSNTKDTLKLTNSNQKLPQDETHTPTHLLQHQARRDLHGTHTSTR